MSEPTGPRGPSEIADDDALNARDLDTRVDTTATLNPGQHRSLKKPLYALAALATAAALVATGYFSRSVPGEDKNFNPVPINTVPIKTPDGKGLTLYQFEGDDQNWALDKNGQRATPLEFVFQATKEGYNPEAMKVRYERLGGEESPQPVSGSRLVDEVSATIR